MLMVILINMIDSLNYASPSNIDASCYTITKKSYLLISPSVSSEKHGKLLGSQWRQMHVFQNTNFHLNAWVLLFATDTYGWCPWIDRLTSSIFKTIADNYPNLNNNFFLSVLPTCRKLYLTRRQPTFTHNAQGCTVLFLKTVLTLPCSTGFLRLLPNSPFRIFKRHILKGQDLIKLVTFTLPSMIFHCFLLSCMCGAVTSSKQDHCLVSSLPTAVCHHQGKCQHSRKGG